MGNLCHAKKEKEEKIYFFAKSTLAIRNLEKIKLLIKREVNSKNFVFPLFLTDLSVIHSQK